MFPKPCSETPRPRKSEKPRVVYLVLDPEDADAEPTRITLTATSRRRWALEQLMAAGETGCTPLHRPAPRWSGYIADLRRLGVQIETRREQHDGTYPGQHGVYVLRSRVKREVEAPKQYHGETGGPVARRERTRISVTPAKAQGGAHPEAWQAGPGK